jgi:hypothetical protein
VRKYFDHYLKDVKNGWDKDMPEVRWSALQSGERKTINDIEYSDFPIPGTGYREFFLAKGNSLRFLQRQG